MVMLISIITQVLTVFKPMPIDAHLTKNLGINGHLFIVITGTLKWIYNLNLRAHECHELNRVCLIVNMLLKAAVFPLLLTKL